MRTPRKTTRIKKPERWQTHVYIDESDYRLLKEIADQESRSVTAQIQHFVRIALQTWQERVKQ